MLFLGGRELCFWQKYSELIKIAKYSPEWINDYSSSQCFVLNEYFFAEICIRTMFRMQCSWWNESTLFWCFSRNFDFYRKVLKIRIYKQLSRINVIFHEWNWICISIPHWDIWYNLICGFSSLEGINLKNICSYSRKEISFLFFYKISFDI